MAVPTPSPSLKAPMVLVASSDPAIRRSLAGILERQGCRTVTAQDEEGVVEALSAHGPDLAIIQHEGDGGAGPLLLVVRESSPSTVCVILAHRGDASAAFRCLNEGAWDYFEMPIEDWQRFGVIIRNALKVRDLQKQEPPPTSSALMGIVGRSPPICRMRSLIERVARTRAPVLVLGESGTGKELVARALHEASPWASAPFVDLNCAAIPANLMESELFGHERGAFTGAERGRPGLFQLAGQGTLFLDEVGDMPLDLQAKLLRVLATGSFRPLGASANVPWRGRLVTATNRDPGQLVRERLFREDLLYRLNVLEVQVPPLRERSEDIPLLVWYFVDRFNRIHGRDVQRVAPNAMRALQERSYIENNVRQLENIIERAMVLTDGPTLSLDLVLGSPMEVMAEADEPSTQATPLHTEGLLDLPYQLAKAALLQEFSTWYLASQLDRSGGNIAEAARLSGQDRPNFKKLLGRFQVKPSRDG